MWLSPCRLAVVPLERRRKQEEEKKRPAGDGTDVFSRWWLFFTNTAQVRLLVRNRILVVMLHSLCV